MLVVWILLGLLATLVALLTIPLEFTFSLQRDADRREARGTLVWLLGLVRVRLARPRARRQPRPARPKTKRRTGGRPARRILAMLRTEGFAARVLQLTQTVLRRIQIRQLNVELRLGLDDPADTGRLWAVVGPVAGLLALPRTARIVIEPEFAAETFDIHSQGRVRLIPIRLLLVILAFTLSPRTLRALRAARAPTL